MTALIKKLFSSSFKHKKLSEDWGLRKRFIADSEMQERIFLCKSLGTTLVSDPADCRLKEEAIRMIVLTIKASGREPEEVLLDISAEELKILTPDREIIRKVSIYDVSYCMADSRYDRVFAIYIATAGGDMINECLAFRCPTAKAARFVALSISEAFFCAYTQWKAKQHDGHSLPGTELREKSLCDWNSVSEPDLSRRQSTENSSTNGSPVSSSACNIERDKNLDRQMISHSKKTVKAEGRYSHINDAFSLYSSENEEMKTKKDSRNSFSLYCMGDYQPWNEQSTPCNVGRRQDIAADISLKGLSISPPTSHLGRSLGETRLPWPPNLSPTSSFKNSMALPFSQQDSKQKWTVFEDL